MFVITQEVIPIQVGAGITRKVLVHSDRLMLCEVHMRKGTIIPDHAHPHEQSTYIISGSCRFTIGETTKDVNAGDTVLISSNLNHTVVALTDIVVVDVFSPAREDFLNL